MSFRPASLHGVHAAGRLADVGVALQHILYQSRFHRAHAEGVGKEDGGFQRAQLLDLHQTRGLAKAVDDMAGRQDLLVEEVALVRQQSRDAGLHAAVCQRTVPHRYPRHVADLIQRPVGQLADGDVVIGLDAHSVFS